MGYKINIKNENEKEVRVCLLHIRKLISDKYVNFSLCNQETLEYIDSIILNIKNFIQVEIFPKMMKRINKNLDIIKKYLYLIYNYQIWDYSNSNGTTHIYDQMINSIKDIIRYAIKDIEQIYFYGHLSDPGGYP